MTLRLSTASLGCALLAGLVVPCSVRSMNADNATQSLVAVRETAEQAVRAHYAQPGSRIEIASGPMDLRLQLSRCEGPLRATIAEHAPLRSVISVPVQCTGLGGWTVRVPVRLHVFRQVLITSRALLRGDGISAADVQAEERDVTRLGYGYIENFEQIAGRSLSRAMARNTVLSPAALGGRRMVRAGDHVQMLAQLDGIEVRADGIALGSGDNGARLRVRNANSGRIVDAMVSAPGVVVALP